MISDEIEYRLLRLLDKNPHLSQRELAKHMGISLGKVNYCLRALMEKGVIKARNFYHNKDKSAYAYFLTPKGIQEKAQVTYRFLKQKMDEYEVLRQEIELIQQDVNTQSIGLSSSIEK
jgi:EPS-associated MarR family transcriptional regulator